MEDLHKGNISLSHEYFSAPRLEELKKDFVSFKTHVQSELKTLMLENRGIVDRYTFDKKTGRGFAQLDKLSHSEKKLYEEVSNRFSFANFFIEENGKLKNRNEVYYSTLLDDSRSSQVINLCMFLDTNLAILQGVKKEDYGCNNFILASIFDDIRYKFILLFEDILDNDIDLDRDAVFNLTSQAVTIYYNYLLSIPQFSISHSQLLAFVKGARKFIVGYLEKFDKNLNSLRTYREGDIPVDNLLLVSKLKKSLPLEDIQCIIGIRFGGIELPFLIKNFIFPDSIIKHVKISKYSSPTSSSEEHVRQFIEENRGELSTKNVLVVDDSITTARSAKMIIEALKHKTKNIYYSCLYHPEAKRIPQMRMDGHGGVNLDELKKCCVLKEANYTASANTKSYLGKNKKFDLTKEAIKERLAQNPVRIKFTPKEKAVKGDSTKKVFVACDKVVIADNYDALSFIRNHFNSKKEYQIVDDWIGGKKTRVHLEDGTHQYREIDGRNFLHEAINDIQKSDIVVLYYPAPSVYMMLLFRIAEAREKDIWICYSHKEDTKVFDNYSKKTLIQIQKLKSTLSKL
jgi:hypoxanthine-guanine phosphoribosyltransferase